MTSIPSYNYSGAPGGKKPPSLKQLIQAQISDCYKVQPAGKPVKVHPPEDINMIDYSA
jgi:hypothetical protein